MRKKSRMSWFMLFVFMMTIFGGIGVGVPQASAATLTDIQGHWAQATIQKLADAGIVAGRPDGTFRPNDNISRAEFASLIVNAFKLEAKTGKIFSDTANHWAKDSIATANANGVVSGYGYGDKFGPDDPITREQMAIMIVKAAKLAPAPAELTFTDTVKISSWAKNDVVTAFANKLMIGYNGYFNPQSNASKAETAVVISAGMAAAERVSISSLPVHMDVVGYYALGDATTSSWTDLFSAQYPQSTSGNTNLINELALGWYSMNEEGQLLTQSDSGWQRPDSWNDVLTTAASYKLKTQMCIK